MIKLCVLLALASLCNSEVAVISEPIPGQEYVFVHTSQGVPIIRKGKNVDAADRPFETAHKLPESLTFRQEQHEEVAPVKETKGKVTKVKRQAAAPPGSIKIDPAKLIEKYSDEVEPINAKELIDKYRSEIEASKATTTKAPSTTKRSRTRTRTKKEAPVVATTPNSVLTTGAPSTPRTLKIRDTAAVKDEKIPGSSSENKRSRIQIKKGPNGQEYEYEYVYYYYDDDDEDSGKAKVSNSHDGPARNTISGRGRHSSTTAHPEPAANEVVPSTRGTRGRGRQLNHEVPEEKVPEEKLPLNTRFPPRSRNINTTPASAEEEETKTQRTRTRGRPQAQDNTADETQVSGRGRNRANVRRPSLELVDSASFNTHSSNDPAIEPYKEPKARGEKLKNAPAGPSFPSELPEGPVRFLGATPNEKMDLQDLKSRLADDAETSTDSDGAAVTTEETGTTEMNAMDKVALDLYAILQGTQKLSGENEEDVTETDSTTTESADTTDETTTEVVTTEEITTPTTTTTTTTTTPAPTTTTTTPEPVTGRGKFRGRPGAGGARFKSSPSTTSAAPEPSTEKPKGRFGRPGFGSRPRPGARTTTEATESEVAKEEAKPVSNARPSIGGGRNRFAGRGRTPVSTTSAPESSDSTTAASGTRPGLTRPRPGSFNLRRRGGATTTTKEPSEESSGDASPSQEDAPSTTAKTPIRGRVNGNLARPLRPGPRINLAARGRPGAATSTTAAPEAAAEDNTAEEAQGEGEEKIGETTPANVGSKNSLNNLRNRPRLTVGPATRPKQAGSSPVQVRRQNPLLRKKPIVNAEPSETPTEPAAEASTEVAADEEAPSEAPSSTTEEPRGLNKLLAGRRRLVQRPAANH